MRSLLLGLCLLVALSMSWAFVPAFSGKALIGSPCQTARANDVLMACRFNAKKEKRKRNNENARKYRMKTIGPKFLAIKTRKRASKAEYSKRLEQYEMDFTAKIFVHTNLDDVVISESEA